MICPPTPSSGCAGRWCPTLEALVAIAQRRDALQAELVETEALRRSDDIKTAVLRAVSHDLRTPLTAIVAAGHALGGDSLTPRTDRSSARPSSRRATGWRGWSTTSWRSHGFRQAGPRRASDWVSVEDLIAAAAEGLRGEPVDVRLTVDPDVPDVRADAAQLERAFANLLENAAALRRRHAGRRPRPRPGRGDRVLMQHRRPGPGITSAEQARIFEPFYRGRSAARRRRRAPGWGWRSSRGSSRPTAGRSRSSRCPGQGTSFVVSLPVAERGGRDGRRAGHRGRPVTAAGTRGRERILVCDDEPQILRALRVILRDAGYEALPGQHRRGGAGHRRGVAPQRRDHRPGASGHRRHRAVPEAARMDRRCR